MKKVLLSVAVGVLVGLPLACMRVDPETGIIRPSLPGTSIGQKAAETGDALDVLGPNVLTGLGIAGIPLAGVIGLLWRSLAKVGAGAGGIARGVQAVRRRVAEGGKVSLAELDALLKAAQNPETADLVRKLKKEMGLKSVTDAQ